ncbi:quinoprotein dehydrogenase-associated SoxYZ-like carrier [Pseudoxanthobacter sp. M-2]|uniref:quinoprotein dehydrogenase-associated SoxYZ-like carrier n=1 Tax=Pseudoxanthobacter sp. M-2 TaxID=3078754 RepID=UPI0038FC858C
MTATGRNLQSAALALALVAGGLGTTLLVAPASAQEVAQPAAQEPAETTWEAIRADVVGDTAITAGEGIVEIEAPYRAHDAAIVPIDVTARLPEGRTVKRMTLVIDENPAPVAATFTFGEPQAEMAVSTRVRINSYSWVRAIVEADDGSLYMSRRYVKASGGCSAPALKDADAALAQLGKMKVRFPEGAEKAATSTPVAVPSASTTADAGGAKRLKAQIMIRHPNYSGLQMNQLTQLYIPAHFVNDIEISQGGQMLLKMEGGISLSEDPTIAFDFVSNGSPVLDVKAIDTDGQVFSGAFPVDTGRS